MYRNRGVVNTQRELYRKYLSVQREDGRFDPDEAGQEIASMAFQYQAVAVWCLLIQTMALYVEVGLLLGAPGLEAGKKEGTEFHEIAQSLISAGDQFETRLQELVRRWNEREAEWETVRTVGNLRGTSRFRF